jgi:hypothetical protein
VLLPVCSLVGVRVLVWETHTQRSLTDLGLLPSNVEALQGLQPMASDTEQLQIIMVALEDPGDGRRGLLPGALANVLEV